MTAAPAALLLALGALPLGTFPVPRGATGAAAGRTAGTGTLLPAPAALCGPEPSALEDLPSYPPCFEVELSADASGRPPLTYAWTLPDGRVLTGNPLTLDTGLLADGYQEILLTVSNSAGVDTSVQPLVVEVLGFEREPEIVPVDGLTVQATAHTRGATAWRWSWGDGTSTGWATGCDGYAPVHTYPAPGSYTVTVEARSCRSGPISRTGVLELGTGPALSIETFQAVCPAAPFCSVEVGETLGFETSVSGTPDAYVYDWDGDGLDDQVAAAPVGSHAYPAAGYFTPRLTVVGGTSRDSLAHAAPIEVLDAPGLLFSHGFESGDLSGWEVP